MIMILKEREIPPVCIDCPERLEGEASGLGPDAYCYNCDEALSRYEILWVDENDPQYADYV